jgi:hypothetical protein
MWMSHHVCKVCDKKMCTRAGLLRHEQKCKALCDPDVVKPIDLQVYSDARLRVVPNLVIDTFVNNIITPTFSNQTIDDEYALFQYHLENKNLMNNVMVECGLTVASNEKQVLKLHYVKEMCVILNMRNSFDRAPIIVDEQLDAFGVWFKSKNTCTQVNKISGSKKSKSSGLLTTLFGLRVVASGEKIKYQQCVTGISGILSSWNGLKLVKLSSAHDGSRRLPNKDFVCRVDVGVNVNATSERVVSLWSDMLLNVPVTCLFNDEA